MSRRSRNARKKVLNISMGDLLDKAREKGMEGPFIDFMEGTLHQFAGDFADHARMVAIRMGAVDTHRLVDSIFPRSIVFKEGDAKAGIAMELYAYYVNAGVGRGVTATERQTGVALTSSRNLAGLNKRTPKPFIDESVAMNEIRLIELLGQEGSDFITGLLAESLSQKIKIEL